MKRSKRLRLLLGVLAVACVATFAAAHLEETQEQIKAAGAIVLEVPTEDIVSLSWDYDGTALSFYKDTQWLYAEDEAFPVDAEKLEQLLQPFAAFGTAFTIEEVSDFGMYGLDEPECVIHFATQEQSYTIQLGDFSTMDQQRYVSIGDGNVYLAKVDPLEEFDVVLSDLILNDPELSYQSISQIRFAGEENATIFYDAENPAALSAEDVYFLERDGETLPLDTGLVEDFLEALTTLNPSRYVTYHATQEELERYNLSQPELTITVDYTDQDGAEGQFVLAVSRNPEEQAAAEEAEAKGEAPDSVSGYIRIGDSQIIYEIWGYKREDLMAVSYDDLRARAVFSGDFDAVTQLDITLDGADYSLTLDKDSWQYQGEEIDLSSLQTALEALRADSRADFTSEAPSGKEELRLILHLDQEQHSQLEVVLYRRDGSDCLAQVNGESFARVSRSDVVKLVESINAIVLQ